MRLKNLIRGIRALTLTITLFTSVFSQHSETKGNTQVTPQKTIVIPIEEEIDFGLHAFLKRAIQEALAQHPDNIVFKVNTYGGELQSAFEIVDLITSIQNCHTYAFVEQKAISAGALISLASQHIVMGPSTTLGDCAPITQGQEGIVMLGEKIQSPLRAKFRTLAERNGYPSLLAEAMVTTNMGVIKADNEFMSLKQWEALTEKEKSKYTSHRTLVPDGQLLTMTDREAKEYGFSKGSFVSLDAFIKESGFEKIGEINPTWSEKFVRLIGKFTPILLLIGFGALYLEFKTPGASFFGVIGFLSLAIVFGSKYMVGLANHTELVLLIIGFALFLVEIFLFPGTLIAGALAILILIIALTLSLQTFILPHSERPWELKDLVDNLFMTVGSAVMAIFIPLIFLRFVLPYLPGKAKVIADTTLSGARSESQGVSQVLPGQKGITKTGLRPTGKALFDGKLIEVRSQGEFIEPNQSIEVSHIIGNQITVRQT